MSQAAKSAVILLVDDEGPVRYVTARILRGAGHDVREAATGTQALEMLAQDLPDLVILDVKLPGVSGSEVLRQIRSNPATAALPAMFLSATFADEESIGHGLAQGADAYLTKPVAPAVLLGQVAALLRVGRTSKELLAARQQAEARAEQAVQAEEALRQTEAELREAQRVARVGSWYWDTETDTVSVSDQVYRMLGLDPTLPIPVLREREWQLYTPASQERVREAVQRALRTGDGYTLDVEAQRADGSPLWLTARAEAVRGADGRIIGLRGTNQDIAERKQAEEERERLLAEVARQAQVLDAILANTPSELAYLDRNLCYLRVNSAYAANARMAPDEFVGRNRLEVFPNAPEVYALYRGVVESGQPATIAEYTGTPRYRPEAGPRCVRIDATPVKNRCGDVEGIVTSMMDITESIRQRERLLAAEHARAEIAEHMNDEIDHRVKNNLAMVSGLLQVQLLREQDPHVAGALRDAIGRIRTFVTLHGQMYASRTEEADLLVALQQVAAAMGELFAARGDVAISVRGDPFRCSARVATNLAVAANELVTNALKYGGPGADGRRSVTVSLHPAAEMVTLSVWNSGNPIPADVDPAQSQTLGLRLVHDMIVGRYGGRLRLCPFDDGTLAELVVPGEAIQADSVPR